MISIGVITPTYNRPDLLKRLHLSIERTTREADWIHYVVDDGSGKEYQAVLDELTQTSDKLRYQKIENSGPLAARNQAIDMALADDVDFLCFLDDDDVLLSPGLDAVAAAAARHRDCDWLIFHSKVEGKDIVFEGDEPKPVDWFQDAILNKTVRSDSFCIVSTKLIGRTRFSEKQRNQREWTFFLDLHEKNPSILLFPMALRGVIYLDDGLTAQTDRRAYHVEQLSNNVERAFRYWKNAPTNKILLRNLFLQILSFPIKAALGSWVLQKKGRS